MDGIKLTFAMSNPYLEKVYVTIVITGQWIAKTVIICFVGVEPILIFLKKNLIPLQRNLSVLFVKGLNVNKLVNTAFLWIVSSFLVPFYWPEECWYQYGYGYAQLCRRVIVL